MIPAKVALILPRLATEHVGELVATRDAIARTLKAAGLDWHDVAMALKGARVRADAPCTRSPTTDGSSTWAPGRTPSFGDQARACRDLDRGRLSGRERAFVAAMCAKGFSYRPSPRQATWLGDIFNRLNGRAAA